MKKKLFFMPLALAALAFTSCSNDDLDINGSDTSNGEERYLAVSIVPTDGSLNARAGYDEGTLNYEDGLTEENEVKAIRFYFFGPNGSPINVKGNESTGNYYDVTEGFTVSSGTQSETVEKKIDAIIVVKSGEQVPSKFIAVVNPTQELLNDKSPYSITDLRRFVNDYATKANVDGRFVMSNSTYAESGNMIEATQIMPDNFQKNMTLAKQHPVTIYVERNVAKVRVKNTIANKTVSTDGGIMVPVLDKTGESQLTINSPQADGSNKEVTVWVKFYGWDIAADLKYAYLLKDIDRGWRTNVSGYASWNDAAHHRSYWANVCGGGTGAENMNQYCSYNDANYFKQTKFDGTEWKYCNENAEKKYNDITYDATSVLIKGELCDQDGNPLTVTEIAGSRIIDDNNGTNLKKTYLEMLKVGRDAHTHYKVTKNADGSKAVEEIDVDDITFITAGKANTTYLKATTTLASGRFYSYAQLKADVAVAEWYTGLQRDPADPDKWIIEPTKKVTAEDVNRHLYELGHAKIWKSGMTYYFTDIQHYTGTPAVLGTVRNHIYDINLTKVIGIGTPVYDPAEIIIPEIPTKEDTYVAAEIKILSWRLVSNDVSLDWSGDMN